MDGKGDPKVPLETEAESASADPVVEKKASKESNKSAETAAAAAAADDKTTVAGVVTEPQV